MIYLLCNSQAKCTFTSQCRMPEQAKLDNFNYRTTNKHSISSFLLFLFACLIINFVTLGMIYLFNSYFPSQSASNEY
ncbi:hypothetical protein B566_EDAN003884 [Ephemera danica]|nr:hypothetical protein B566_EDAN003884 [Ephemera danica]